MKASDVRIATLTLSDTRTAANDEAGRVLGEGLRAGGYHVVSHAILREEPDALREELMHIIGLDHADAIVTTGGTGVSPRDRTIDTIVPMMSKLVDGFGEAFRRLSWEEIGPNAILSRAMMAIWRGRVVIALPGSTAAVQLAVERLIVPTLAHAFELASGQGGHHPDPTPKKPKT